MPNHAAPWLALARVKGLGCVSFKKLIDHFGDPTQALSAPQAQAPISFADTVERVRANLNPRLDIQGVVLTMFDKRNALSGQRCAQGWLAEQAVDSKLHVSGFVSQGGGRIRVKPVGWWNSGRGCVWVSDQYDL